jgi:hypothetical protein
MPANSSGITKAYFDLDVIAASPVVRRVARGTEPGSPANSSQKQRAVASPREPDR